MNINDITVTGLFSVPLAGINLSDIDNASLLNYVKKIPFVHVDTKNCEISTEKKIHDDPMLFETFQKIREVCHLYSTDILGLDLSSPDFFLDIKTSWVIKMKPGDNAIEHHHCHSIFSGIFYLNVDENKSNKLRFYRPLKERKILNIDISKWNIYNSEQYYIVPKSNDLFLFPSNLNHSVDRNESDDILYSIVFDVFAKGIISKGGPGELVLI